ncbi:hypothetical protein Efla_006254 [Eimeria flavescens]
MGPPLTFDALAGGAPLLPLRRRQPHAGRRCCEAALSSQALPQLRAGRGRGPLKLPQRPLLLQPLLLLLLLLLLGWLRPACGQAGLVRPQQVAPPGGAQLPRLTAAVAVHEAGGFVELQTRESKKEKAEEEKEEGEEGGEDGDDEEEGASSKGESSKEEEGEEKEEKAGGSKDKETAKETEDDDAEEEDKGSSKSSSSSSEDAEKDEDEEGSKKATDTPGEEDGEGDEDADSSSSKGKESSSDKESDDKTPVRFLRRKGIAHPVGGVSHWLAAGFASGGDEAAADELTADEAETPEAKAEAEKKEKERLSEETKADKEKKEAETEKKAEQSSHSGPKSAESAEADDAGSAAATAAAAAAAAAAAGDEKAKASGEKAGSEKASTEAAQKVSKPSEAEVSADELPPDVAAKVQQTSGQRSADEQAALLKTLHKAHAAAAKLKAQGLEPSSENLAKAGVSVAEQQQIAAALNLQQQQQQQQQGQPQQPNTPFVMTGALLPGHQLLPGFFPGAAGPPQQQQQQEQEPLTGDEADPLYRRLLQNTPLMADAERQEIWEDVKKARTVAQQLVARGLKPTERNLKRSGLSIEKQRRLGWFLGIGSASDEDEEQQQSWGLSGASYKVKLAVGLCAAAIAAGLIFAGCWFRRRIRRSLRRMRHLYKDAYLHRLQRQAEKAKREKRRRRMAEAERGDGIDPQDASRLPTCLRWGSNEEQQLQRPLQSRSTIGDGALVLKREAAAGAAAAAACSRQDHHTGDGQPLAGGGGRASGETIPGRRIPRGTPVFRECSQALHGEKAAAAAATLQQQPQEQQQQGGGARASSPLRGLVPLPLKGHAAGDVPRPQSRGCLSPFAYRRRQREAASSTAAAEAAAGQQRAQPLFCLNGSPSAKLTNMHVCMHARMHACALRRLVVCVAQCSRRRCLLVRPSWVFVSSVAAASEKETACAAAVSRFVCFFVLVLFFFFSSSRLSLLNPLTAAEGQQKANAHLIGWRPCWPSASLKDFSPD